MDDYLYDVFVSYRHRDASFNWLRRHFHPMLSRWLPNTMGRDPAIFVDWGIEVGSPWPAVLRDALLRSRCLLAIWSPEYFRSSWCLAEWHSFRAREEHLGLEKGGLIYAIQYADGDHFPPEAKLIQMRDLRSYNCPEAVFAKTKKYVELDAVVQDICAHLAQRIDAAPPWQEGWPVELPPAPAAPNPSLPRLK